VEKNALAGEALEVGHLGAPFLAAESEAERDTLNAQLEFVGVGGGQELRRE